MSATTKKRRRTSVFATVEVDLCEIDDEALIEECENRGMTVRENSGADPWQRCADAIRYGRDPLKEVASIVEEITGRILQ